MNWLIWLALSSKCKLQGIPSTHSNLDNKTKDYFTRHSRKIKFQCSCVYEYLFTFSEITLNHVLHFFCIISVHICICAHVCRDHMWVGHSSMCTRRLEEDVRSYSTAVHIMFWDIVLPEPGAQHSIQSAGLEAYGRSAHFASPSIVLTTFNWHLQGAGIWTQIFMSCRRHYPPKQSSQSSTILIILLFICKIYIFKQIWRKIFMHMKSVTLQIGYKQWKA